MCLILQTQSQKKKKSKDKKERELIDMDNNVVIVGQAGGTMWKRT